MVLTEDLIYGFQGGSALRGRKLGGKPVTDALGLHVGDYLIHPEHGIGQFQGLETRTVIALLCGPLVGIAVHLAALARVSHG